MLRVQGAEKFYKKTIALNGVDFEVRRGEVVGLFGDNGAGKTTLLKAAMNLLRLNCGSVTLDRAPLIRQSYEKLSFITEEGSFFADLSPHEHGAFYKAMLPRFKTERYDTLLEFFQLPPDKKARTLSHGQRAKLEIAVGMSRGADFVLMDEPFLGKDIFTRRDFLQLMIVMLEPSEGVVIATHQISEIEMFITRAVVLHEGRIAADETMDDLAARGESLIDLIRQSCRYDEQRVTRFLSDQNRS